MTIQDESTIHLYYNMMEDSGIDDKTAAFRDKLTNGQLLVHNTIQNAEGLRLSFYTVAPASPVQMCNTSSDMELSSDKKETNGASVGALVHSIPSSPTVFKKPVAIFAPMAPSAGILRHAARLAALQKYNVKLADDIVQLQGEKKTTTVDGLAEAMGQFAYYHVLPFVGEDECVYPILVNRELASVWSLQTQAPDFATKIPNLLWEQLWQLSWKQVTNYHQCLRVRHAGGTYSRGSMTECSDFPEAVAYSQEIMFLKVEKMMPPNLTINPRTCCVYEIENDLLLVFRNICELKPGMPRFFCTTVKRLNLRIRQLEQVFEHGYTENALTSYAKHASPSEFKDNKRLHLHIVTAIVLEVTARFKTLKQSTTSYVLKNATESMDPFELSMAELIEVIPATGLDWDIATEKLLLKLTSKRFSHKNETVAGLLDGLVRLWFCTLVQYVVPAKVYQWCLQAHKKFGGKDTIQETYFARWTSAACNVLAGCCFDKEMASAFYNPAIFKWAPDAYIQLPRL